MNLLQRDRKFLARDSTPHDIEIRHTDGNFIIDSKGKKYIDFLTGWCVGNIGWGNKEIRKTIKTFDGPDYVSPSLLYRPWVDLAELLAEITPGRLTKSFRATGGTEAVEIALRAANVYTQRHKYISIEGSYHGDSIGAMSVGSSEFRKHQKGLLFRTHKIKPPFDDKAADHVEKFLQKRDVAALIMEPIICNLAVEIPEPIFMTRIQKLCRKYGTLLIIDEVATGFGRTGKMFGAEHYRLAPDIMTMGKAITGGYGAMGAVVTTREVAKVMEFDSSYYSTYGWHPLSVAAAIANIKFHIKNQRQLQENVHEMSEYFRERLSDMNFKSSAEIRIKGLAIGVEFESDNYVSKLVERARKKGLLFSSHSEKEFTMFPALNIDKKIAQKGLDILERCL